MLQCNAEFYRAFREGDAAAMERIWTARQRGGVDMATCVHPGREAMSGRAAILDSWRQIMAAGSPDVRPEAVKVRRPTAPAHDCAGPISLRNSRHFLRAGVRAACLPSGAALAGRDPSCSPAPFFPTPPPFFLTLFRMG